MSNKFKFIFIIFIPVFLFIVLMIIQFIKGGKDIKNESLSISPTSIIIPTIKKDIYFPDDPDPVYEQSLKKIEGEEREDLRREELVSKLLNKLPYKSDNFSMSHSVRINRFIVTIKNTQGESDFDQFLKENGISDRSWIRNLIIN